MTQTSLALIRRLLVERYDEIKRRLEERFEHAHRFVNRGSELGRVGALEVACGIDAVEVEEIVGG